MAGGAKMIAMPKLKVLDLFSGSGGFSLGLERTGGFETVAFCEIEEYPRLHVLGKHWPGVPQYDDVRNLTARQLAEAGIWPDVIVGGFPCQDISLAGKGEGLGGDQSGLWREFIRLIREVGPRIVIVENVAALLKRGLGDVLRDLAEAGYDAEWDCLPASFVGAPHNRDRIWIIAYPQRDEQSRPEPCFGALGRMGRVEQPVPWDTHWEAALSALRGMDDGLSRSVDRTDLMRNAVVPQIPELIGRAILQAMAENNPPPAK
jgi:DNA (cytosine-5)-methyltransferase 1